MTQSPLDATLTDRVLYALQSGPHSTTALCDRLLMRHKGAATDIAKACQELERRKLVRRVHYSDRPSLWEVVT